MQNPIQKFIQTSIVFKKPGILSENLKTLMSSNYPTVQYFLLKFCTHFLLTNVYKRVCRIFILFRSWVICKNKKDLVSTHLFFNNSRSKQNEKNPKPPFLDIAKLKTCAKIQQKMVKLYSS